jgi:hypothetical protein
MDKCTSFTCLTREPTDEQFEWRSLVFTNVPHKCDGYVYDSVLGNVKPVGVFIATNTYKN